MSASARTGAAADGLRVFTCSHSFHHRVAGRLCELAWEAVRACLPR